MSEHPVRLEFRRGWEFLTKHPAGTHDEFILWRLKNYPDETRPILLRAKMRGLRLPAEVERELRT